VVSDTWSAGALHRAEMAGIPTAVFPFADYASPAEHDLAMAAAIKAAGADLVVMAGYMRLLAPHSWGFFPWRVIKPPSGASAVFPRTTSISDALRYGVKVTGVTVHSRLSMDTGPVILQEPVRVERRFSRKSGGSYPRSGARGATARSS